MRQKRTPSSIDRKLELFFAALIAVGVLLLVNLPLIYFTLLPKGGLVFLGRRVINSQDVYTYVSFIEQSKQGKYLFQNMFTSEQQSASLFRPSYLVLGKIAALFRLSSIHAYHVGRVIFSISFFVVVYCLIQQISERPKQRLLMFGVVLFSSGLGWLLGKYIGSSSDLWIPESNTFLTLAESPHFILAQTLLVSGLLLFIHYLKSRDRRALAGLFLLTLVLAFEHPFDLLILGPVIFCLSIYQEEPLRPTILISGLCTAGVTYPLFLLRTNPLFASEQAQGVSYSPSPLAYLSGFGLLTPFAIWGAEKVFGTKSVVIRAILIWLVVGLLALFAPVSFQRRLSEGIHIPLAIVASVGVIQLYGALRRRMGSTVLIGLTLLCGILTLTSLSAVINDFKVISGDSSESYYYYISQGEHRGLDWLAQHTSDNDVILANWFYGNIIPGITGRKVFLGHKAQTIHYDEKVTKVNAFLLNTDAVSAKKFLKENHISYIFLGDGDTMLRYGFHPEKLSFLELVFRDKGGALIYKVL